MVPPLIDFYLGGHGSIDSAIGGHEPSDPSDPLRVTPRPSQGPPHTSFAFRSDTEAAVAAPRLLIRSAPGPALASQPLRATPRPPGAAPPSLGQPPPSPQTPLPPSGGLRGVPGVPKTRFCRQVGVP